MNKSILTYFFFIICILTRVDNVYSDSNIVNNTNNSSTSKKDIFKSVSVQSYVDKNQILTNDIIRYTVIIKHAKDILFTNTLPDKFDDFEIVDRGSNIKNIAGDQINYFWYNLKTDDKGDFTIPSFKIYFTKNVSKYSTKTSQIFISVKSRLDLSSNKNNNTIKDVKSLLLASNKLTTMSYIIILLLIIILIFVYFYFFSTYFKKQNVEHRIILSPYQIAVNELNELDKIDINLDLNKKKIVFSLSFILRKLIENTTSRSITELTTEEILKVFNRRNIFSYEIANKANTSNLKVDKISFFNLLKKFDDIKYMDILTGNSEIIKLKEETLSFLESFHEQEEALKKERDLNSINISNQKKSKVV